uniref:Prolyl 4-hydroxylase alpha subunit Fe(2+) 2OG dioxygenase domain-containing protein n=1 Tax=viral metagenome TaxID=1070528 RepID=A0A6C0KNX3_9ZZZZ
MNIIEKNINNNIYIESDNKVNNKLSLKCKGPSCKLIIVDNFYNNAMETRNFILSQEFSVKGNYPGQRTVSYANEHLKDVIQKYVEPFAGKIVDFPLPNNDSDTNDIYNGAFQYTLAKDRSWMHTDKWNNWAGIVFLTPDAPLSSGTAFYRFNDGAMSQEDTDILLNQDEVNRFSQDLTKWELVDKVGNVFNRLILFDANRYHVSCDYFGDTKENGRLFQVFFFSTER